MTNETEAVGEITDLSTEEVSLVDRAANKKTFLIVKSEEGASVETPVEKDNEELLEQSQGMGQETADQGGAEEPGHGGGSGEGQTGETPEVDAEVAKADASEELIKSLQGAVEAIRAEYQAFQASLEAHPVVIELRSELKKAQEGLLASTALNTECRDLLAKVRDSLAGGSPSQVTKAAPETIRASNINTAVIESELVTQEASGFLRTGQDLNKGLRKEKSKK